MSKAKKDRWEELCDLVREDDGLLVREVGSWTEHKLLLWHRYLEITTVAMRSNPAWSGLVYVDLFCGPGVCVTREGGKRLPGSPILAAHAARPFDRLLLVDKHGPTANACRERILRGPAAKYARVWEADSADVIDEVCAEIPKKSLTLAFVDPTDLGLSFSSLEALATQRRVDFLLYFADAIDLNRNVDRYVNEEASKIDRMLGSKVDWRGELRKLPSLDLNKVRELFLRLLTDRLRSQLGYEGFRAVPIHGPKGLMYSLLYASKHPLGVKFWDSVSLVEPGGQGKLF